MPTPVSETRISTRPSLVGAQRDRQRAAVRHRLHGVLREVEQRLPQDAGIGFDLRHVGRDRRFERHAGDVGFDGQRLEHFVGELAGDTGLQRQLLGPRELQEALHHIVQPANLAGDDVDVRLGRAAGRAPAASFCFSSSR